MDLPIFFLMTALGAASVWVEGPAVPVLPSTPPPAERGLEYRLYAAGGERESFQVVVHADGKGIDEVRFDAPPVNEYIGAPDVREVGYVDLATDAPGGSRLIPDPLPPFLSRPIPPNESRSYWITYAVPRGAEAGYFTGDIGVYTGAKRRHTLSVAFEVFDFALPARPELRSLFRLNRSAIRDFFAIGTDSVEDWRPIYTALATCPISYSVWDGRDWPADVGTAQFKGHLAAAVSAGRMNTIDVGPAAGLLDRFPAPKNIEDTDTLQRYLLDVDAWLKEKGWLDRAVIRLPDPGKRASWPESLDTYFRVQRADPRVQRILSAPLHPAFERYTDIWSVSADGNNEYAHTLLREGRSIAFKQSHPAIRVTASANSESAIDALDGCFFTGWSGGEGAGWIEAAFDAVIDLDTIRIAWMGRAPHVKDLRLRTSVDANVFVGTTTSWTDGPEEMGISWLDGEIRVPKPARIVRLEWDGSGGEIAEILLGNDPQYERLPVSGKIAPWLQVKPPTVPSFDIDAGPRGARLLSWVCWGLDADGFLAGALNDWPDAWGIDRDSADYPIADAAQSSHILFYPGESAPIPSIRSEFLRDGIEDYDYLALLRRELDEGTVYNDEYRHLVRRERWPGDLTADEIASAYADAAKQRVAIGRALTRVLREKERSHER